MNSIPGLEEIKLEEKVQVEVPNAGTDVTEKSSVAKIPPAVGSVDNEVRVVNDSNASKELKK